MGIGGFLTIAVDVTRGLLPRAWTAIAESGLWGQGVWGGEPGPAIIKERCTFAPMPDYERRPTE